MDARYLETARRQLEPYRRKPGDPEAAIFGVPLSALDKDDLIAVIAFQAAQGAGDERSPLRRPLNARPVIARSP